MTRSSTNSVMYAVSARARLPVRPVLKMKHLFASYFLDDPVEWKLFRNMRYIIIPTREDENIISLTLYIQHTHTMKNAELQKSARNILHEYVFPKECGAAVVSVGTPKLFLRPQNSGHAGERRKGRSQKLLQRR